MSKSVNELFQPSLKDGWSKTKSYDINHFFLVAFIGGPIPMMVLGTRNAKWLHVPKLRIYLLITISVLVQIVNLVMFYMYTNDAFAEGNRMPRFSMQILSILLFFLYKFVLNKPFQQHLLTDGETQPLFKPALLWILIGVVIKLAIIVAAFMLTGNVD
ncbi:hypothetical protein D1B31_21000 [Neobacillus notoginsengisoli]|uniref:Uncharacterized protein n=1 Tax=Neobacillus notoginsengisoli TaxID=1578198 RepID=A0A417YIQ9_9BACI|nr:hypothetical protein [Neobacillus notoginsengisoli]RHW32827.1 hypothetical protein D1B31_21000 [Neobacillus notoginsengisoli]